MPDTDPADRNVPHDVTHDDFSTRHAPMPIELPLDDEEASTNVDLNTQLVRFIATGALSAVIDFGLTLILQYAFGASPGWSKAFGFFAGTTVAYLINRRWTFRAEPSAGRFVAVLILYLVTFGVNVGLYSWLSHLWAHTFVFSLAAFVVAQGVATTINFVVQRAVIFKIR